MSRTTLCTITAAALAALALGVTALRCYVLGAEVKLPAGPPVWKVVMVVQGHAQGEPRLVTAAPLDVGRQHVLREEFSSPHLTTRGPEPNQPRRRPFFGPGRVGGREADFRARGEFSVAVEVPRPGGGAARAAHGLYAAPQPGEHLDLDADRAADREALSARARALSAGLGRP